MIGFLLITAILVVIFYYLNPNLDYLERSNGHYDIILWYTPFWDKNKDRDYITIF
jgi:hypothetical protein